MLLSAMFARCLHIPYRHVGRGGDYATERAGAALTVYFQDSDGARDWINNLAFPAKAYRRMGRTVWWAHRGFLRVWKSVEPYLAPTLCDPTVERITVVGYSHGAALAVLCHEYVWFHRPDLRDHLLGFGFGCPRVIWGRPNATTRARWANFTVVRNLDDPVTHLPPSWLGFTHVGQLLEIGTSGKYPGVEAHRPENMERELVGWESSPLHHHERIGFHG